MILPGVDLSTLLIVNDILKKVFFFNSSHCNKKQWILFTYLCFFGYFCFILPSQDVFKLIKHGLVPMDPSADLAASWTNMFLSVWAKICPLFVFLEFTTGLMHFLFPPPAAGSGCLHRWLFEILHTARVASCVPPGCRPHNNKKALFFLCSNTLQWKKILLFSGALQPSRTGINLVT